MLVLISMLNPLSLQVLYSSLFNLIKKKSHNIINEFGVLEAALVYLLLLFFKFRKCILSHTLTVLKHNPIIVIRASPSTPLVNCEQ